MALKKSQLSVGLDIGRGTVKAVAVDARGGTPSTVAQHVLDCRAEGLVDDPDALAQAVPEWLVECGLRNAEVSVTVPQYLSTVQVSDFPPSGKDTLEDMVEYETQQVAGLSEDSFLRDYVQMKPGGGRRNPVLIGIAKSSVVDDRVEQLEPTGVRISQFTVAGISLANAYLALHPEAASTEAPHLLIDLGMESSTVAIVAAGQLVYAASLLFGCQRYSQELARDTGLAEEAAEERKRVVSLDDEAEDGPLHRVTRQLEAELRETLDHWREQNADDLAGRTFGRMAVCGGGARLGGLVEQLGRNHDCEAMVFGVPAGGTGTGKTSETAPNLETVIAYGSALQGGGLARFPVSLTPAPVLAHACRRRNFPALVFGVVLLAVALVAAGVWRTQYLRNEERILRERIAELEQCQGLIPQLEKVISRREHLEQTVLPIVAKANRAHRVLDAVEALSEVRGEDDWFIYLADEESYQRTEAGEGKGDGKKDGPDSRGGASRAMRDDSLLGFGLAGGAEQDSPLNAEFPDMRLASDTESIKTLVAAGFSKYVVTEPYKFVRAMVDRLNGVAENRRNTSHEDLFTDVDLLPNTEVVPEKRLFEPWLHRFKRVGQPLDRFKPFMLKLPFAEQPIKPLEEDTSMPAAHK